jgi:hypothetical protein
VVSSGKGRIIICKFSAAYCFVNKTSVLIRRSVVLIDQGNV